MSQTLLEFGATFLLKIFERFSDTLKVFKTQGETVHSLLLKIYSTLKVTRY